MPGLVERSGGVAAAELCTAQQRHEGLHQMVNEKKTLSAPSQCSQCSQPSIEQRLPPAPAFIGKCIDSGGSTEHRAGRGTTRPALRGTRMRAGKDRFILGFGRGGSRERVGMSCIGNASGDRPVPCSAASRRMSMTPPSPCFSLLESERPRHVSYKETAAAVPS